MLAEKIKYTDYNGTEREETFYFNLSKAELIEMEYSVSGGLTTFYNKIVGELDTTKIMSEFKKLIAKSYGQISADGRQFIKSEELSNAFMQTEAYSELLVKLISQKGAAAKFVNGIVPAGVRDGDVDKVIPIVNS